MANTNIGRVTATVVDGGLNASVGSGAYPLWILGCTQSGTANEVKSFSSGDAIFDAYGYGPAVEVAMAAIKASGQPVLFTKLASNTAGAVAIQDDDLVTGTSSVSIAAGTGGCWDEYDGIVECVVGGTIGTSGVVVKVSLDGGETYSAGIGLGTATTLVIPGTNLTVTFGAGTLVAGDAFHFTTTAPDWDNSDFSDAFTAVRAQSNLFRLAVLVGEAEDADVEALKTEIDALETTGERASRSLAAARDRYQTVRQVGGADVTWAAAGKTLTRASGSWIDDGFVAGMSVFSSSTTNPGPYTIASLTATVITVTEAIGGDEGPAAQTITAYETEANWIASLRTEFDDYAGLRTAVSAGRARYTSQLRVGYVNRRARRPVNELVAIRFAQQDFGRSLARVASGALPYGASLENDNEELTEHDSRLTSGLASLDGSVGRFVTAQTHDGYPGIYISTPSLMHTPGSDYSRIHLGAIADESCNIVRTLLRGRLADDLELNSDGTLTDAEANDLNDLIYQQLEDNILELQRASALSVSVDTTTNLTAPGSQLKATVQVVPRFYIEGATFEFTLAASLGTS